MALALLFPTGLPFTMYSGRGILSELRTGTVPLSHTGIGSIVFFTMLYYLHPCTLWCLYIFRLCGIIATWTYSSSPPPCFRLWVLVGLEDFRLELPVQPPFSFIRSFPPTCFVPCRSPSPDSFADITPRCFRSWLLHSRGSCLFTSEYWAMGPFPCSVGPARIVCAPAYRCSRYATLILIFCICAFRYDCFGRRSATFYILFFVLL